MVVNGVEVCVCLSMNRSFTMTSGKAPWVLVAYH